MATQIGTNGNDGIMGSASSDLLDGLAGDDLIAGQAGRDDIYGRAGDDWLWGGDGDDRAWGGADSDDIRGGAGSDALYGDAGDDELHGDAGNDRIVGGAGSDILWGGAGADTFVFEEIGISDPEDMPATIVDFSRRQGDVVDLQAIDADTTAAGDQAFTFIGTDADFSGRPGELRFIGDPNLLEGDVDGDGVADLRIAFYGDPDIMPASLLL